MKKQVQVLCIGAGEIGNAISHLLSVSKVKHESWDAVSGKVINQKPLDVLVSNANVIFFCIPSWALVSTLELVVPFLSEKTICVFVSKGIEKQTGWFLDELVKECLPKAQPKAFLLGPMLAEEITKAKGSAAVLATISKTVFETVEELFPKTQIYLKHQTDVKSFVRISVLKNVYAILMGIAHGCEYGSNKKGWLCSEMLQEMQKIMKNWKCNSDIVLSLSGIGDFIATGFSDFSLNQEVGNMLVSQKAITKRSEGLESLSVMQHLFTSTELKKYPLLSILLLSVLKKKNPKILLDQLFCG